MSDKKWYNYFVSVEPGVDATGAAPTDHKRPGQPSAAQRVADIAAGVAGEPRATPSASAGASFDEVYRAAEIQTPAHGYTISKIAEMLRSEHIRRLAPEVKRSSILVALEAASVKIDEIIQDAVRRDRALDTYERVQQKGQEALEAGKAEENRQIQADLDRVTAEHRARIQANQESVARARQQLDAWRQRKREEEDRIADAVSYFVTENPVTRERPAAASPPRPASAT